MPKVSIIIVHYFGWEILKECLASVFKSNYDNYEVIVVFNGNKDDSLKLVEQNFPKVKRLLNQKNLGFAKANNQGIKQVTGELIFLLNDDTIIHADLISQLVENSLTDKKIGIIGPKIFYYDQPQKVWFAGGEIDWQKQQSSHNLTNNQTTDVDFITGCALMIRIEVIEKIGLLDETFFAFYEDADWCQKAKLGGFRVVFCPFGGVWHHKSSTAGTVFFGAEKKAGVLRLAELYFLRVFLKEFRLYRNKFIFYNRYLGYPNKLFFILKYIFIATPALLFMILWKIPASLGHIFLKKKITKPA